MEQFSHLPEFQVVICKKCKYAVLPSCIDSHFAPERPHGLTRKARRQITDGLGRIGGLIKNEEILKSCKFPFPADTSSPIAALAAPQSNGFRCTFHVGEGVTCPYVCGNIRNIRKHSWSEHGWKSINKGGRPKKDAPKVSQEVPWRSGVLYQRIFVQGPKSGFFEVGRDRTETQPNPAPVSQWEKMERAIDQGRAKVAEAERRKIAAIDESMEPSPWLRFTGWPDNLGTFDPVKLQAFVRPVQKEEETELHIIHEAFMSMIQEAQSVDVKKVVGKPALMEANRKERGKKSKKPFNSKMSRNTFRKYTTCWKQLLSYIVRCEDLEEDDRPTFKFTSRQRVSLDGLMEATDQLSDYQEEGKSDDDEVFKEAQVNVQQALLRFCIALLDHNLVDNEYQSAIISGLAVLGVREDKGWDNPEDYTPKLSAVIKLSRLMVIQMAYQTRQDTIAERVGQGWSQERAEEECPGHVELVQGMCRKFMMLMDENGKPTPMDWMFEARTYGLHIRYSITADGNIRWKGNNMSIGDINCDMEQIRSMISGLVSRARRRLITQLLKLRLDGYDQIQGMPLPPIEWERLWDNPAEQATGWSFLKDIRNKFTVDGVEGSKWLAKRVIDEEALRKDMTQPQKDPDQPMKWRKKAIQTYEHEMEAFEEELLILMH